MSKIYVGTYSKYNDGNLFGAWLDLEDYADKEEFETACRMLHRDEDDPELMFQDWEEIPAQFIGESHIDEALWDWLSLSEDDKNLLSVYLENVNQNGDLDEAQESYLGTYESEADWAQEYWEETGLLESIPKDLQGYIDYESYARDQRGDICFVELAYKEVWVFRSQ